MNDFILHTANIPSDFLERNDRGMRFLFRQDKKYMRLFYVSYKNGELYLGSSLKKIICAGSHDVGEVTVNGTNRSVVINTQLLQEEYKSLKFSFHQSGVRHLRCLDKSNSKIDFYRENCSKLEDLMQPEMLFTIISKRMSLYTDYTAKLTKNDTNAVVLDTPVEFKNCRNIFEFFISQETHQQIPSFIIPKESEANKIKPIKLRDNLFLHVRYIINIPESNRLNLMHFDREILLFNNKNKLYFFSFK